MTIRAVRIARRSLGAAVLAICTASALAAVPAEQQAIVQSGYGGPEVLKLQTIPVLQPGSGQVLIQVYAAAVNPTDWKMREGNSQAAGTPSERVPGLDVAGVIAKVGAGVSALKEGQAVFSMLGRGAVSGLNGGYSHYVIAPAERVAPKPKNVSFAEAAGLGVAAMTGARTVDLAKVSKRQRVLITGIAGGVGSAAAQVALVQGAYVVGTASPRHAAYLKSIGVKEVVDYTQGDWSDKVKEADVVIDTVGGDSALTAFNAVKKGGTFVTVASRDITAEKCVSAGIHCPAAGPPGSNSIPEAELMKQVADLVTRGKFKTHVDKSFPLAQAADAQEYNRAGHTEGKVVLIVTPQASRK